MFNKKTISIYNISTSIIHTTSSVVVHSTWHFYLSYFFIS